MIRPLVFTLSLERRRPAVSVPRDPIPIVQFDRLRETRHAADLRGLSMSLAAHALGDHTRLPNDNGSGLSCPHHGTVGCSPGWAGIMFARTAGR